MQNHGGKDAACYKIAIQVLALLTMSSSSFAQSHQKDDHTYLRDKFFSESTIGTIAIVSGKEQKSTQAYELTWLTRSDYVEGFKDRSQCVGVISHHDNATSNTASYFGLQILYIYDVNPANSAVFVTRNQGWRSRKDNSSLDPINKPLPVNVPNVAEFAAGHASLADVERLNTELGQLSQIWHAKLANSEDTIDSSGLHYWHHDPTGSDFAKLYSRFVAPNAVVRVENRLMQFTVTDATNAASIPNPVDFNFFCGGSDPHLQAVMLRVFAPTSIQSESSYVIAFR